MNTHRQPHRMIARKVSVKRRYGASMPTVPSDRLRRRCARPEGQATDPEHVMRGLDQCHARLAAMPTDFLNWVEEAPVWPVDARECIGAAHDTVSG